MSDNVPLSLKARRDEIMAASARDGLSFFQRANLLKAEFQQPKWYAVELEHYSALYSQPHLNGRDRNYIRVNAGFTAHSMRRALKDKACADFGLDAKHVNGLVEEALQRDFWSATVGAWRQIKRGDFHDASSFINYARGSCVN